MQPQSQSTDVVPQTFVCLEDRFLQALYNEKCKVSLQYLADPISITPSAALSIVHRIKKDYPQYIYIEEESRLDACCLERVPTQALQVQQFLDAGGFTRINNREFFLYFEKELKKEKRRAQLNVVKTQIKQEKWAVEVGLLVGMGIVLATYLRKKQQY